MLCPVQWKMCRTSCSQGHPHNYCHTAVQLNIAICALTEHKWNIHSVDIHTTIVQRNKSCPSITKEIYFLLKWIEYSLWVHGVGCTGLKISQDLLHIAWHEVTQLQLCTGNLHLITPGKKSQLVLWSI